MDRLTLNEGILICLVEERSVDGGNVVHLMRKARSRVLDEVARRGMPLTLDREMDGDEVDSVLIMATRNGAIDLFA